MAVRSCLASEPNFDLAWRRDGTVFVAEVKSINDDNEEEQLRLGSAYRRSAMNASWPFSCPSASRVTPPGTNCAGNSE
jgi:hypothetical protein